jgi:inhibitor of cysteine peptidase
MKRTLLAAALFCISVAGFAGHAPSALSLKPQQFARIDARAVWNPAPNVLSDIRQVCAAGDPGQQEACFLDSMKSAGASAEAVAFAKSFADNGAGYLRAFRDTGRVDVAYVEYVFRANEMDGVFLVNGEPAMIDVDDYRYLSREDLRKNSDYLELLQKYPQISVWPDDRYHTELPTATISTGDNPEFNVEYLLQDGCRSCARIGTLVASFIFDGAGRLAETRILKVRPGSDLDPDRPALSRRPDPNAPNPNPKEGALDPTEVHATVGASFTIALPANHTTSYSWRLAKPLDSNTLRQVSETYSEDNSGRLGGGGKELWTFEALRKGSAEIDFEYARPFEKDAAPVNKAKYRIEVR